jgi:hypothetical protein
LEKTFPKLNRKYNFELVLENAVSKTKPKLQVWTKFGKTKFPKLNPNYISSIVLDKQVSDFESKL